MSLSVVGPSHSADEPLTFLHYWTGPLNGGISETIKSFNSNNAGQFVQTKGLDHESFKAGIRFMLSAGSPPDLFSYWAGARVQSLVELGHLAPIDDVWRRAELNHVFTPAIAKACTYNGKKYALPLTQHYVSLFYNVEIFKQHNLQPPRDWDEFITVCATLKNAGVTPIALGAREKWPAQFWFDYLLLRTAGDVYRNKLMTGKAYYTDPEVERVLTLWRSMLNAGYFNDNPVQLDWAEAAGLLKSGEAAMTLMGTWIIGLYDGQLEWKQEQNYDFFKFPTIDANVTDIALGPVDVIVIPNKGNSSAAKNVLAYFSDTGPQLAMSKGSGALAPSQKVPSESYTPMQRRILEVIQDAPHWAFNYDLATPPAVAEYGLDMFKDFLRTPQAYLQYMTDTDRKARRVFEIREKQQRH